MSNEDTQNQSLQPQLMLSIDGQSYNLAPKFSATHLGSSFEDGLVTLIFSVQGPFAQAQPGTEPMRPYFVQGVCYVSADKLGDFVRVLSELADQVKMLKAQNA